MAMKNYHYLKKYYLKFISNNVKGIQNSEK